MDPTTVIDHDHVGRTFLLGTITTIHHILDKEGTIVRRDHVGNRSSAHEKPTSYL